MLRRLALTAVLFAVLALIGANVRLTTDTVAILPADSGLADTLDRAQRFSGAQSFLVEVDGTGVDTEALRAEIDRLTDALAALPHVTSARSGYGLEDGAEIDRRMRPLATAFVPVDVLAERTSEDGIRTILQDQLALMTTPAGMFKLARIKDDPLDLIQAGTEALAGQAQPGVVARDGLLMDTTGTRALILATSSIEPGTIVPGDPRVRGIQAVIDTSTLPVTWFGGQRIGSDTADTVQRDVRLTAGLGILLLATVLLVGFRSWRPLVGAIGPAGFAAASAGAAAWWVSPVHGIQLGFSAALAGLAVDYWVHLYLAAAARPDQATRAERYRAALEALHELGPALLVSAGSTTIAFAALATSSLPIVRVLGVTGAAATVGALVGTALLGPLLWAVLGRPTTIADRPPPAAHWVTPLFIGIGLLGLLGTSGHFAGDPMDLIAPSASTSRAERVFADRYGLTRERAILLVDGADAGQTLDRAARIQHAIDQLGFVRSMGPTGLIPGPAAVAARRAVVPQVGALQARIDAVAAELGLPPFAGAAQRIHQRLAVPPSDLWTGSPLEPRANLLGSLALVTVALPDDTVIAAIEDAVWAVDKDVRVVVPGQIAESGLGDAREAILGRAVVGGFLIWALLSIRHRSPIMGAFAVLPATAAVIAASGAMVLAGIAWNPVSLAAMVPVVGLAIDYGVFSTEASTPASRRAVLLSALTTVAGFVTLLLANLPALFGVGVATVAGIGTAALVALVALPSMITVAWPGRRTRRGFTALAFSLVLIFHIDVGLFLYGAFTPPDTPNLPVDTLIEVDNERRYGTARFARTQGIWLLRSEGDPVTAGYSINRVTQRIRPRLENELFDTFDELVPNPLFRWIITRGSNLVGMHMHPTIIPAHQREIRAGDLADPEPWLFKGPPYTRKIYYHAIHDLGQALVDTPLLACTGFMAGPPATANGHWLLGRNFDFEGGVTFDRDKIVRVHRPDDGIPFLSVAFAGLAGAVSGVNEAGIAVAINASASDDPPRLGTPMTLIVREILERARTLDDAERILRERNGFLSENVLVVDADHGEAALFEVTPKRLARIDVDGALGVSNHFRSPEFADDETTAYRMSSSTTVPRLARMNELLEQHRGAIDMEIGLDLLTDRKGLGDVDLPRGHRSAIDADIATHGVLIDATTRTVRVSRYPNLTGGFVELSLKDVLAGDLEVELVRDPLPDAEMALLMRQVRLDWLRRARRAPVAEALDLTERALAVMPDHPETLTERGRVLLAAGRREEALPLLRRALAAPPEYPHQVLELQELLE